MLMYFIKMYILDVDEEKNMMDYILHLDILRQLYRCCWTCVGKVDVWVCFFKETFLLTTQEKNNN